jgi:parallel beta-helix repeat protein
MKKVILFLLLSFTLFCKAQVASASSSSCTTNTSSLAATICAPLANASVSSTFHFSGATSGVTSSKLYVDGKSNSAFSVSDVEVDLTLSAGTHRLALQAINSAGTIAKAVVYVSVQSGATTPTPPPPPPTANNYYVSPSGSDSNNGSSSSPWATIRHADSVAQPGWTIHVAPGTYGPYSSAIVTYANGTPSAHIRYVSDVKWGAKISGSAADVWATAGAFEDIEGFDISSSSTQTTQVFQSSAYNVRFIGNRVHDMKNTSCLSGAGIHFGTGSSYNSAIGNFIFNIGMSPAAHCNQAHGIYISTSNNLAANNIVFNTGDLGIQIWGSTVNNNSVINNTLFGNWRGLVIGSSSSAASGNYVANNIIAFNLDVGGYETGAVGSNTVTNNVNYGNGRAWGLTSDTAVKTISADPQFMNYKADGTGDYHVKSSSPAINAGAVVSLSTDYQGGQRVMGGAIDGGAYEYGSTAATWPWE